MSRSRPDAVFLIDVAAPAGRRQLLVKSPRDLAAQLQPLVPDLLPVTVRQLAALVLVHDAQVQLTRPVRLTLKHSGTLTRDGGSSVVNAPPPAVTQGAAAPETGPVAGVPGAPRGVRLPPPRPLLSADPAGLDEGTEHDDA